MKNYTQDDNLKSLIDWDAIMPMSRYAGGHDDQMRGLLKGATVLAHYNEGDYQGDVATMVRLPDGRVVAYCDYYGSCSGCDSWENATDDDVRTMCESLANGAYVWPNEAEAVAWLAWAETQDRLDGYQWNGVAGPLLAEYRKEKTHA